jgi:hypothetical protein
LKAAKSKLCCAAPPMDRTRTRCAPDSAQRFSTCSAILMIDIEFTFAVETDVAAGPASMRSRVLISKIML